MHTNKSRKFKIIAKVVSDGNHVEQVGCICISLDKAMSTPLEGFIKMQNIGQLVYNNDLAYCYTNDEIEIVNGRVNTETGCIEMNDCAKGKEILVNERRVIINECKLVAPMVVLGKIQYSDGSVVYRVSNSQGVVSELTTGAIKDMIKRGRVFVNIKTTFKDGNFIISSIKGEMLTRKIEKCKYH